MKPDFALIDIKKKDEYTVLTVDVKKATLQGRPWISLSDFGKRRFENLIYITRSPEVPKILYV